AERRHLTRPVDLAAEPAAELGVVDELGLDHLDRHRPPVAPAAEIDRAHAALTQAGLQPVAAEPAGVGRPQLPPHGCRSPDTVSHRRAERYYSILDFRLETPARKMSTPARNCARSPCSRSR